ncbi:hypothetical protein GCM10011507_30550 [Edaphobacter acidisoli]|uniref:AsmA-like C-terminal domain-containing protein n=2 Tax=Edaphobacter acidisoli TaxID=2040573 RepID=A0A916RZQ2_9BACT|nr:hypothetical protein [Edaphobacter acidisoli]GGA77146.1 hypothetical protein GCM10011507_30550 [Edaphobacter acidisoli]
MDNFHVSIADGLAVSGKGLRIFPSAGGDETGMRPLITLGRFSFHVNLPGLFASPMHVGTVHVSHMKIDIPPRSARAQGKRKAPMGKIRIVVQQIVFDDSQLVLETDKPDKEPKEFDLKHIVMRDVGPNEPWLYDAALVNSIPAGNIHATGTFGPWTNESPGDSAVTGHYTFEHADLDTIKGIGGVLSSVGDFKGRLDRIEVDGTTDTPDFSLDTAKYPMPLHTRFHAIVDGTSGDTYLDPVEAQLGTSDFTCNGTVVNVKGKGHIIDLDADVPHGAVQDFLSLGVAARQAMMTGMLQMKAHLHIDPGEESVSKKMKLQGQFALSGIHFTDPVMEDKVDMLSLRTSGHPKEAKPGAPDVHSKMVGEFVMADGKVRFSKLNYALPGATVELTGLYSLDGRQFDFSGKVRTDAKISQMVATRWKSWLLKPVDPFFAKNGAGAVVPIRISGTQSDPKFGLNLHH